MSDKAYEQINEWRYQRHLKGVQFRACKERVNEIEREKRDIVLAIMSQDGMTPAAFTAHLNNELEPLTVMMARLERDELRYSTCDKLVELIGLDFHDFYQMHYPINRYTEVGYAVPDYASTHHYLIPPPPTPIEDWINGKQPDIPPTIPNPYKHGTCKFERFGDGRGSFVRLAYAPEINVVFIASRI